MFTPLLRLLLPPPYPMLIITATNAGSGKTLLMRLLGIVHGIATRGEFPREREELRKLIISTLYTTTAPVIGLDNMRGTIYSSELEALLTARTAHRPGAGAQPQHHGGQRPALGGDREQRQDRRGPGPAVPAGRAGPAMRRPVQADGSISTRRSG